MSHRTSLLLLVSACAGLAQNARIGGSCDLAAVGLADTKAFLRFDRELRDALSRQDPAALALLVRFPLRINDARGSYSLNEPLALQSHFMEVFPPVVREAVLKAKAENVFCNYGGIMYGDGEVWVGVSSKRYVVQAINLPGPRGSTTGPTPKLRFVCDAEKHRVVIDTDTDNKPRYRAWNKPRPLSEKPDVEISMGSADMQGTGPCAHSVWTFMKGATKYTVEEIGCVPESDEAKDATGTLEVSVGGKQVALWWCY